VHVPLAQVVGPVHLQQSALVSSIHKVSTHVSPPHWPYNAEPVPLEAVEVAALVDDVVDDDLTVVIVVDTGFVVVDEAAVVGEEPPAPQVKGVGPGITYVVRVW
jgi:hypothetical protein